MKNAITKPKKPYQHHNSRMKAITSIVLSTIIGVMAGLIILALSSSNAYATPMQDRDMRSGEVGVFHTIKDAIVCGSFSEWLDMRNAILAQSSELVVHYINKPNSLCVTAKEGLEVIVTESNDRWVEGKIKAGNDYITIWTHPAFLKKKGV